MTSFPRLWNAIWKNLKRIGPPLWGKSCPSRIITQMYLPPNTMPSAILLCCTFPFRCVLTTYSGQNFYMTGLSKPTCTRDSRKKSGRSTAWHRISITSLLSRFLQKVTFSVSCCSGGEWGNFFTRTSSRLTAPSVRGSHANWGCPGFQAVPLLGKTRPNQVRGQLPQTGNKWVSMLLILPYSSSQRSHVGPCEDSGRVVSGPTFTSTHYRVSQF